ncbi:MAG: N-acetylglucosaminyl-diphospho-decaprenol L-rhamnosyltransferase [Planctomycetota bacterium]|jgi:N-acetylglucosaminyl-diphospho-decaprenol L-rhamnosyltransferase
MKDVGVLHPVPMQTADQPKIIPFRYWHGMCIALALHGLPYRMRTNQHNTKSSARETVSRSDHSSHGSALWSSVRRGSSIGVAAQSVYLVSRFLLTPLIVSKAGLDAYGFWSILFVALGLLGIHRMGLLSASVAHAAAHLSAQRTDRAEATLRTTATVALLCAVPVGFLLLFYADRGAQIIGISAADLDSATLCIRITGFATLVGLVFGGWQSALEARQQHARVRITDALAQLVEAGLLVLLLISGAGLVGLAVAYAVRVLLPIPFHRHGALQGEHPLRASPGLLRRSEIGPVLRLGGAIQLLGTVHLGIAAVPRFALAHSAGLAMAGTYEVARKLVELAAALPAHGLAPITPAAAALGARGRAGHRELLNALRTATRLVALAGAVPTAIFMVSADDLVQAWLGHADPRIAQTLMLLAPAAWLHLTTGALTAALRGLARPRAEVTYAVVWLALALVVVPTSGAAFGLAGVALGVACTQAICCLGLWAWAPLAREIPWTDRLRDLSVPALGPVLAAACCVPVLTALGVPATRGDAAIRVLVAGSSVAIGALPFLIHALRKHRGTQPPSTTEPVVHAASMNTSQQTPIIDAVVVTYNSLAVVGDCLESLRRAPFVRTYVVDSASQDKTAEYVRRSYREVDVSVMPTNRGFGSGCNEGIARGVAPLVLLLNPDATLEPGELRKLVAYLEQNPEVAAVGPAIVNSDGGPEAGLQALPSTGGELARTCEILARKLGLQRDDECLVDASESIWISGACMLIRRSALEDVGAFDESFFLYYEETDWCLRAQALGWWIAHLPGSVCTHIGGASSGDPTEESSQVTAKHFRASRRRYFRKHHGVLALAAVEGLHLARRLRVWARPVHDSLTQPGTTPSPTKESGVSA